MIDLVFMVNVENVEMMKIYFATVGSTRLGSQRHIRVSVCGCEHINTHVN